MDVTALYIRLLMVVLILLAAQVDDSCFAHKADAAFPQVIPDKLQFFDYDTFTVNCQADDFTEWRVMRKLNKIISTNSSNCNTLAPSCSIEPALEKDSGGYWCENQEGRRSSTVNITVTAGSVILEIPAHPVMEGYDVILHCRNKKTQFQHIAEFYKDRSPLGTVYTENLTIQNVSKSHEGLYKCSISTAGESPESRLTVIKQSNGSLSTEADSPHVHSSDLFLLWIVVTALLVTLLLLVVGLCLCRKHNVSGEDSAIEPDVAIYSVVNKQKEDKVGESAVDPDDVTYASVIKLKKIKGTRSSSADDTVIYSMITL